MQATRGWVAVALAVALPGCLTLMDPAEERELGQEAAEQVAQQMGVMPEDSELVAYVQQLGEEIAELSANPEAQYSFDVVDMIEPNAFALPGGPVYVSRGLLPLLNSENELANVLAHEVGHVVGRHHARAQRQQKNLALPTLLGTVAAAMTLGEGAAYLAQAAGQGMIASHSREQEEEADEIGQKLASAGGWDPYAMSSFLHTLDRTHELEFGEAQQGSFFATHPAAGERVVETRARAATLQRGQRTSLDHEAFLAKIEGVLIGQDPAQGIHEEERNVFLHPDLGFRIRFPEHWMVINAPDFVGASEGDQYTWIKLELQGEAIESRQAALDYLRQEAEQRAEAEEKGEDPGEEIDQSRHGPRDFYGRKAYWIEGTVMQGQATVALYWVPIGDYTFRVTCFVATQLYEQADYERHCEATARSLRGLKRKERERIRSVRLGVMRARAGETLEALGERTANTWSVGETAVANGLEPDAALSAGQLIKVAIAQPYVPAPPPEPPAAEPAD